MLIEERRSPSEIAEKLNDLCIPSPRMKQWSRVTVRRMLSNPSYLGILYIRRYDTRECHLNKFKKKGEKVKVKERPHNEWIPIRIPQIIDKDIWEKAQDALKKTKRLYKKRSREDFVLTSLLKCGMCGSTMNNKIAAKGDIVYRYYICAQKYRGDKDKDCKAALIKAEDIENTVLDKIYSSICIFMTKEADMNNVIEQYISDRQNDIKNIFRKKEKTNLERQRIMTMFQKAI